MRLQLSCSRSLPPPMLPPTARRRRQLLAEQERSSSSSSSSSSQVPDWVASDPVWQVAQAAAAAGMSEHSASGVSAAETDESRQVAETAALWANFTASGGSLLPSWSLGDSAASSTSSSSSGGGSSPGAAIEMRSLDLSTEDTSSYEDAPLPDPPAYDGSEGTADAQHRHAVVAANYSTAADGSWEEEGAAAAAAAHPSGRSAGGRRLAESYFSGPAAGTILSWM